MICYQRAQLGLLIVAVLVLVLGILAIFAAADMVYQKEINKWKVSGGGRPVCGIGLK